MARSTSPFSGGAGWGAALVAGILEEIRPDAADPTSGPFSAAATGADRGLVALRVNIPSTASALASYDGPTTWPPAPNVGAPHQIGPVSTIAGSAPPFGTPFAGAVGDGVLGGEQGLGEMGALGVAVGSAFAARALPAAPRGDFERRSRAKTWRGRPVSGAFNCRCASARSESARCARRLVGPGPGPGQAECRSCARW